MKAKGGADWDTYQNLITPVAQEDFLKSKNTDYKTATENAQAWGIGGSNSRALNAVTMAITGALGGQTDLQVATNSLSPYAAQLIGEQWGHKAAQLTAHAILGATLAYVNGGKPAAGGSAAVAAESAADYLSKPYKDNPDYQNANGEFEANRLPENVKAQIRDLTAAIGAVVGGTVGDSTFNAQLAGVVGQNAVENNNAADIAEALAAGKTPEQQAKERAQELRLQGCAAAGLAANSAACTVELRKQGYEVLSGTAAVLLPTSVYELVPIGKGVGLVLKGTKKLYGIYKDSKSAEKAVEKSKAKIENNIHRDDDLWSRDAVWNKELQRLDKQAEKTSTAKPNQSIKPRDLKEQILWKEIEKNPGIGRKLDDMNYHPVTGKSDQRFPLNYGFQKMEVTTKLENGKSITIHYQYNKYTKKAYDMKIVTPSSR